VDDIEDPHAWRADPKNIYAGRWHAVFGREGLGNPHRVTDHGRAECLRLYKEHTLPNLSASQVDKVMNSRQVACHCKLNEACHVDLLIEHCNELGR